MMVAYQRAIDAFIVTPSWDGRRTFLSWYRSAPESKRRLEDIMTQLKGRKFVASLAGILLLWESFVWADGAVISRVPDPSGSFCHMRFPPIREDTLFLDEPVLKDPSDGDIIDAYGPCDFDPLGSESIRRQRRDHQLRMRRVQGGD
jgi:hypothetical protein